jgi:anti-sigma B factor antagonist
LNVAVHLEPRDGQDVPVVAVRGELDLDSAPDLRSALIEAIDEHPGRQVVVDLEGVDFIDSAGLGVLVGGLERARTRDGDLVLVATGRSVVRVLELTGLTRLFELHASRAAALGAGE